MSGGGERDNHVALAGEQPQGLALHVQRDTFKGHVPSVEAYWPVGKSCVGGGRLVGTGTNSRHGLSAHIEADHHNGWAGRCHPDVAPIEYPSLGHTLTTQSGGLSEAHGPVVEADRTTVEGIRVQLDQGLCVARDQEQR